MTLDYEATYAALHAGSVGRLAERDVVIVEGPDAASYLQGQCSQDLAGMAPGEARRSLLLSPQGKVGALVRVVAAGPDRFLVEVDHGYGEAVLERLARFKLRVKATLELAAWRCAEVRGPTAHESVAGSGAAELAGAAGRGAAGPGAAGPGAAGPGAAGPVAAWPGAAALLLRIEDRFGHGLDLLGPDAELPAAVPAGDTGAFEAVRIEAGVPAMGSELDESVIPQEAGIAAETVSFTKGCYTGQEAVARLDARGSRVPRLLRGVVITRAGGPAAGLGSSGAGAGAGSAGLGATAGTELGALPAVGSGLYAGTGLGAAVGSGLYAGERLVGALTSVAWSPRLGGAVALAFVRREVQPPAELRVVAPGGAGAGSPAEAGEAGTAVVGEVRELPL